jgi:hypothetical protein
MIKLNVNTNGNKKLQNNENIRFMIWNLPAVKTCPYATEHCKKSCYARKAERIYKNVLSSREENYFQSLQADFVSNMIYTIEKELNTKKYKNKLCVFRIHESGDFYNLEYTKKWLKICKHFENDNRIIFLAYTKSIKYFIGLGYGKKCLPYDAATAFPQNLVIRSSLWDDTSDENKLLTSVYNFPIYTALSAEDMETERKNGNNFTECECINCSNCGNCWNKEHNNIIVKIH